MNSHDMNCSKPMEAVQHPHPEPGKPNYVHVDLEAHKTVMKIGTAVFYAISSFFITVINKSVLTSYGFPSFQFLAFGQMVTTVVVLFVAKKVGYIKFPNFHFRIFYQLFPLPFIYVGNMTFGLGSTKELSLPMFTMLRRISIFMTMIGEYFVLKVKPSSSVQISVALMILGAGVAALKDLAFTLHGYTYVLINNLFTASSNIVTKQKLESRSEMGKYGILFYCSIFMLPVCFILLWQTGDLEKISNYPHWLSFPFLVQFSLSCMMGFVLSYSVMLCTQFNSALTTTIIGCLKNILITYLGMFIGGDYVYSFENFVGINISVAGSILYTWVTFRPKKPHPVLAPLKQVTTNI
ncbi:UDP-sugar transporter UST74c-like [Planococcus citri]|uniref:UDP-sugar transporter UST74c-like n=1 Tax=Planococcus citri TaxID=170843 RepID=UPI0031F72754